MMTPLKQFVPSEVCLQCDGCCRFKEADSAWRARISADEVAAAKNLGLAREIFSRGAVDERNYIRTVPGCGEHFCSFFNPQNHACAIYQARPFECELYPFILSCDANGTALYVHRNCPHVEDEFRPDHAYIGYLRDYFGRPQVRYYLIKNRSLINDYSAYRDELEFIFTLDFPS